PKVFCISMQRTGTTSVGKFFQDFEFRWAGWPADEKNKWSSSRFNGDYEAIFSSIDFKAANAYEDSPWFAPEFYKVLYHRFPNAKFILFTRDPDAWYQSMVKHSKGDVIGPTINHCKVYRREIEYYDLLDAGEIDEENENQIHTKKTMKLTDQPEHYKKVFHLHTTEVKAFFSKFSPESLHVGRLEDPEKWQKLGEFLKIEVPEDYDTHENQSRDRKHRN
ncbi:MAG: sulfotransferase, partial [Psychromonas sp.]